MQNLYFNDDISALEAKFAAQKLAFAPVSFQVAKALVDMGILLEIEKSGQKGITEKLLQEKLPSVSSYAFKLLLEFALGLELVKLKDEQKPYTFLLGKTGYFLLNDMLTHVNMNFIQDVCYEGLFSLQKSLETGKPEGLKVFGNWNTIYEGLSSLPPKAKKSWFEFDHYYSDCVFNEALPFVFKQPIKHIIDIGSNTGKFTQAALAYNSSVTITMVDLERQIEMAKQNTYLAPYKNRISYFPTNILDAEGDLPHKADAIWMSQFLDCFSLEEITFILKKIRKNLNKECNIFVLEPIWDKQRFAAAAYSIQATSIYFAAMANGNSKMYCFDDIKGAIERAGFELEASYHDVGIHYYSLLHFKIN